MHPNQKMILELLLDTPKGLSLKELSAFLSISKTAAKEHLLKIDALGYIKFIDSKGEVGRPKRRYLLSDNGQEVFPRQYSWLSNIMLEYLLEDMGSKETGNVMKKLAVKVHASMKGRFNNKKTIPELLLEISNALNELGYRTTVKQSDIRKGAIITATNCVYHTVAKEHPELCEFDISFISNASKMNVQLESCIAKGDPICRFCLRKN